MTGHLVLTLAARPAWRLVLAGASRLVLAVGRRPAITLSWEAS